MVQRRHQQLMLALAGASLLGLLVAAAAGLDGDALLAVPALLLLLPMLGGRYIGEDALVRLVARALPRRRRIAPAAPRRRAFTPVLPRGGRLIAAGLAHRGPPR
jgi:hypothetical protein